MSHTGSCVGVLQAWPTRPGPKPAASQTGPVGDWASADEHDVAANIPRMMQTTIQDRRMPRSELRANTVRLRLDNGSPPRAGGLGRHKSGAHGTLGAPDSQIG